MGWWHNLGSGKKLDESDNRQTVKTRSEFFWDITPSPLFPLHEGMQTLTNCFLPVCIFNISIAITNAPAHRGDYGELSFVTGGSFSSGRLLRRGFWTYLPSSLSSSSSTYISTFSTYYCWIYASLTHERALKCPVISEHLLCEKKRKEKKIMANERNGIWWVIPKFLLISFLLYLLNRCSEAPEWYAFSSNQWHLGYIPFGNLERSGAALTHRVVPFLSRHLTFRKHRGILGLRNVTSRVTFWWMLVTTLR